jgi:hypothetical protein
LGRRRVDDHLFLLLLVVEAEEVDANRLEELDMFKCEVVHRAESSLFEAGLLRPYRKHGAIMVTTR